MTLQEVLSTVEDSRSVHGRRHQLTDVLLMCIMAIMSAYQGYREIGRFLKYNEKDFRKTFGAYHGVPCYVTIRDVLQSIDFDEFSSAFNRWALQYVPMGKVVLLMHMIPTRTLSALFRSFHPLKVLCFIVER